MKHLKQYSNDTNNVYAKRMLITICTEKGVYPRGERFIRLIELTHYNIPIIVFGLSQEHMEAESEVTP